MKLKKCQDYLASQIRWGIELETRIPTTAGVQVGNYHGGQAVHVGIHAETTLPLNAPTFQGSRWKAERDGSIRCDAGQTPCEFVSPILHGEEGVENLHDEAPATLSDEELARVRVHAQHQLNGIRSRLNGTVAPNENVVERVQSNAEERRRSRPRERPATTTDGRSIDWKSVKKLYLRNRSHKQTAAAFDLSVNTVKARARKEGWAQ